jgi:hypothetical protein
VARPGNPRSGPRFWYEPDAVIASMVKLQTRAIGARQQLQSTGFAARTGPPGPRRAALGRTGPLGATRSV